MAVIKELFQEKDNSKREIEERLTSKLSRRVASPLGESGRVRDHSIRRGRLGSGFGMRWTRRSIPKSWKNFFASEDKLLPDQRQELLDKPQAKMEAELKYLYFNWNWELKTRARCSATPASRAACRGTDPAWDRRARCGPNRPPGFGPGREPRPTDRPMIAARAIVRRDLRAIGRRRSKSRKQSKFSRESARAVHVKLRTHRGTSAARCASASDR